MLSLLFIFDQAAFFALGIMLYDIKKNGVRLASVVIIGMAFVAAGLVDGISGLFVAVAVFALALLALFEFLRPLTNSVTLWLGSISYALYLVHRNLGFLALERLSAAGFGLIPALLLCISSALAMAWLVTRLVEQPAISLLRQWNYGKRWLV